MLCKLAVRPEDARPIVWRQIGSSGQSSFSTLSAPSQADAADLERRLMEAGLAHQTELAQSKQNAFQEGMRQGRGEAAVAVNECNEKLAKTLAELGTFKRKLRADAEREVVKLSLAIARRILNRELATDPDALQGIVHAALGKLQARDIWQVRIGPHGSDTLNAVLERAGLGGTVKVKIDPALHPGDLIIETPAGELDASVNTQLHEIERGFTERLAIR